MIIAQYSDGRKFPFPQYGQLMEGSEAVAKQSGKWLFSEQYRGYTIGAHNFWSYDGDFIIKYLLDKHYNGAKIISVELSYCTWDRDTLNFV